MKQSKDHDLSGDLDEVRRSELETKFRRVLDTIPVFAWYGPPDGSNEFLNKRWYDYTGLTPEEAHGWGWQKTFHPDDLAPLMDRWRQLLVSGEPGEIGRASCRERVSVVV